MRGRGPGVRLVSAKSGTPAISPKRSTRKPAGLAVASNRAARAAGSMGEEALTAGDEFTEDGRSTLGMTLWLPGNSVSHNLMSQVRVRFAPSPTGFFHI